MWVKRYCFELRWHLTTTSSQLIDKMTKIQTIPNVRGVDQNFETLEEK